MTRRTAGVCLLLALCPLVAPAVAPPPALIDPLPIPLPPPPAKEAKPKPAARAKSDKPAITGQGKSVGALLTAYRGYRTRGPGALADFDEWFKDAFGEKGLDGVALDKPVGFYLRLTAGENDALEYAWVYAVPVTSADAFRALLDRAEIEADDITGVPGGYEANMGGHSVCFAFHKDHVYLAVNGRPDDVKAERLVDPADLVDPKEAGLLTVRGYPGRFPEGFEEAAAARVKAVFGVLEGSTNDQTGSAESLAYGFGYQAAGVAAGEAVRRLVAEADAFTLRVGYDSDDHTFTFDASVEPKAGTPLAAVAAALTPGKHPFGSLANAADVADAVFLHLPAGGADRFPAVRKHLDEATADHKDAVPEPLQGPLKELFDGLARTLKDGAPDLAAVTVGPDKDGKFGTVYALGFADATKLDPAFRTLLKVRPEVFGPSEAVGKAVTLEADKVGAFPVHTVRRRDLLPDDTAQEVRDKTHPLAVCFTDTAVLCAIGPDPVALVRRAAAAEPADVGAVRLSLNPKRAADRARAQPRPDEEAVRVVERAYGEGDAATVPLAATVDGGKALRVRVTLDPAAVRHQLERNPYWNYLFYYTN